MKGIPWKLLIVAGVFLVLIGLGLAGFFSWPASSQATPVTFSWPTNQPGLPLGGTPLHGAARFGNPSIITSLVRGGSMVDARDSIGGTPLHWAVSGGSVESAKTLLRLGADINATDKLGNTPLHLVSRSDYDVIPMPPPPPWQVRLVNRWPQTRKPMQWLTKRGLLPAAKPFTGPMPTTTWLDVLVDHRANVNVTNLAGETPLHLLAARHLHFGTATSSSLHRIERLVKAGARIDARDIVGETPLALAVRAGNAPIAEALHDAGATVLATNKQGDSLLHIAARAREWPTNLTAWLLDRGAPVNARNTDGRTALHEWLRALGYRQDALQMARLLLENGADRNLPDSQGRTAIHEFAGNRSGSLPQFDELAPVLFAPPAELTTRDRQGARPLHLACRERNYQMVSALIAAGALSFPTNHGQTTPLHEWALPENNFPDPRLVPGLATMALPAGALDVRDANGDTPLLLAGSHGQSDYAAWLLGLGADVACVGRNGDNFLHAIARHRRWRGFAPTLIKSLGVVLTNGPAINHRDAEGNTPLLLAVVSNQRELVRVLMQRGADVVATNQAGATPLLLGGGVSYLDALLAPGATEPFIMAAYLGDLVSVQATLRGEPRLGTNTAGAHALELAVRNHRSNVVECLLAVGAPLTPSTTVLLGRANELAQHVAASLAAGTNALDAMLVSAITKRQSEEALALLDAGASIEATHSMGLSILNLAQRGNPNLAAELRRRGARENIFDLVARGDTNGLVRMLKANPTTLRQTAPSGYGALSMAVLHSNLPVAALLLATGAEPHRPVTRGVTPVHLAARLGNCEMLQLLHSHGAQLDARDEFGLTPLHCAAMLGRQAATEFLLDLGADPNDRAVAQPVHPVVGEATSLHLAARYGRIGIVTLLLRRGADPNIEQWQGRTVGELVQSASLLDHALPESLFPPLIDRWGGNAISQLQSEGDRQRMLKLLGQPQSTPPDAHGLSRQ